MDKLYKDDIMINDFILFLCGFSVLFGDRQKKERRVFIEQKVEQDANDDDEE